MNQFDCFDQHIEIPAEVRSSLDVTYKQISDDSKQARSATPKKWSYAKRALIAAACICVLTTTAVAAYIISGATFFQSTFGRNNNVEETYVYGEDGDFWGIQPNVERVPVDEAKADKLIGDAIATEFQEQIMETSEGTMTLQVQGNVFDTTTGAGYLTFSLTRQSGFPEQDIPTGEAALFPLGISVGQGDTTYFVSEGSTDDTINLACAYIQLNDGAEYDVPTLIVFENYLESGMESFIIDENGWIDNSENRELLCMELKYTDILEARQLKAGVLLSPLGLRLSLNEIGAHGIDYVRKVTLIYEDGQEYVVKDNDNNIANYDYALGDEENLVYCLNRLVDVDNVVDIQFELWD